MLTCRPASSNTSSHSPGSSSTPLASASPVPSDSNSLKTGAIAGIAVGAAVALCVGAAGIVYLFRRRATSQKQDLSKGWNKADEAGRITEQQGQGVHELEQPASSVEVHGQDIKELEHPGLPPEMEGHQRGRQDRVWS